MNQHRDSEQSANSKRMTSGEQLTVSVLADMAFSVVVVAASAVVPDVPMWVILAVVSVAAVWVWVRVMYRIKSADAQARSGARGDSGAV